MSQLETKSEMRERRPRLIQHRTKKGKEQQGEHPPPRRREIPGTHDRAPREGAGRLSRNPTAAVLGCQGRHIYDVVRSVVLPSGPVTWSSVVRASCWMLAGSGTYLSDAA